MSKQDMLEVMNAFPHCFPVLYPDKIWAILSEECEELGTGETAEEAWKDAKENLDK